MPIIAFDQDVEIRTPRLVLRAIRRGDLDLEDAWPLFPEPIYHHYDPPRDSVESKDRRFNALVKLFDLKLSIIEGESLIGYVGLFDTNFATGISWMGIQFSADQRSKGYCKETLRGLAGKFFGDWEMNSMKLEVAVFNLPGVRCYEHVGFVTSRQFWHPHAYQRTLDYEGDPRLAPIRKHFRRHDNQVEVEYLEMELARDTFLKLTDQRPFYSD